MATEMTSPPSGGPAGLPRLLAGLESAGPTMTLAENVAAHGAMPQHSGPELISVVAPGISLRHSGPGARIATYSSPIPPSC